MKLIKKYKNIIIILTIILCIGIFVDMFNTIYSYKVIIKHEEQIINLQRSIDDLYLELECCNDNYIALWNTINNLEGSK